jgi:hypothetical protein
MTKTISNIKTGDIKYTPNEPPDQTMPDRQARQTLNSVCRAWRRTKPGPKIRPVYNNINWKTCQHTGTVVYFFFFILVYLKGNACDKENKHDKYCIEGKIVPLNREANSIVVTKCMFFVVIEEHFYPVILCCEIFKYNKLTLVVWLGCMSRARSEVIATKCQVNL